MATSWNFAKLYILWSYEKSESFIAIAVAEKKLREIAGAWSAEDKIGGWSAERQGQKGLERGALFTPGPLPISDLNYSFGDLALKTWEF